MDIDVLLHSVWLLPVIALLVALDAPFPMLPSEPLLMTAAALVMGAHDVPLAFGLFGAAFVGSVAGDHLIFALGRTSRRVGRPGGSRITRWVRENIRRRPAVTIVGARFVPAGRLVSTAAAGRFDVSRSRFLPCSLASSALWVGYMMGVGVLLGPLVGGNPLRGLVAGIVMGALSGGAFALYDRLRGRREAAAPTAVVRPVPTRSPAADDASAGWDRSAAA